MVDRYRRDSIDSGTESLVGHEMIGGVRRRYVHVDRLRSAHRQQEETFNQ
jgi:hypothetical protein